MVKDKCEPKKKTGTSRLGKFFDEEKYQNNIDAIRGYNLWFYVLFNCVMIFLLLILYGSCFVSEYARTMRYVYLSFAACSGLELLWIRYEKHPDNTWIMPMCYFGVCKAYLFCMCTSVIYNQDAPTITFYVFLILIPVCFTFRMKTLFWIQTLAITIFCALVIWLKEPEFILSDTMNSMIFGLIGIIMACMSTRMRENNFDMYRTTDILEKRNREIFDTTPCGILEMICENKHIEILFANKATIEMFGGSEKDFMEKPRWTYEELVHPQDVPMIAATLENPVVGSKTTYDFRLLNTEDGVFHWVSCTALILAVDKARVKVLANFLNIDDKKQTENESEAKSRFLSRMSHEIRTPINAILGMAELERQELLNPHVDKSVLVNYAEETTTASKYLLTIVNDILDTSRIDSDKIELKKGIVHADRYLQEVVNLIQPLADNKNIRFTCTRKTHLYDTYLIDSIRVQQILVNVLNNAIKFTNAGGSVTLEATEYPVDIPESEHAQSKNHAETFTKVVFTITDTGIGMAPEFQKRVFQPFAQEDNGITSPFSGTGLGLSIARALAQKMDGDITCESRQGVGTTFTVTIVAENTREKQKPAVQKEIRETSDTKSKPQHTPWDFTGVRVLLCEDHPLNQKITKALLNRSHCQVEIAGNGAEGVSMLASHPAGYYNMVLMDIRMPVLDGLHAAAEIRELHHPDAENIPIVAMSANAFPEDVKKSLEAGMNAHLAKPVDAGVLYDMVAYYTGVKSQSVQQRKKPLVLVVDDIEMNAAIVANALKMDYEVETAGSGKEALQKMEASTTEIAAVITDVQMPEMDGVELIREIRKNYKYDQVAILANTQFDSQGVEGKLLAVGADDFVYKAASPEVLANRLRNVLARYEISSWRDVQ